MKGLLLLAALGLAGGVGCGKSTTGDGAVPVRGRHSFDVLAALGIVGGGGAVPPANVPPTVPFTLVLDPDAGRAIVGAKGMASVVPTTGTGVATLMLPAFSVGLSQTQCSTPSSIDFTALAVGAFAGAAGLTLRGTGEGDAKVSCGDCQFNVSFTADVGGTDDATPPVLFPTTLPGSPFDAFDLVASEPLPATATARLVAEDGSTIDLAPTVAPGAVPLVTDFKKPDVVLPTGVGLAVALDGLVDFAGLQGSADTPLRLALFPTPPLVAEDGFESVTGTTFGGATVISDGPLPPIAGTRSVYFGGPGTPAPGGGTVGTVLRVRLAAKPGAKELAFEYRLVGVYPGGGFSGTIHVGSVGKAPTSVLLTGAPAGAQTTWPDGRTVYVTDVESEEVPLPADVGPEVLVDIESFDSGCGRPAPPLGGMLLDGLRLQ